MERIRVGHDTYGSGKGIFVDDIEVAPDDEEALYFPCSCWLAEDIGDGKLEREIYPGTRTPQTSGRHQCCTCTKCSVLHLSVIFYFSLQVFNIVSLLIFFVTEYGYTIADLRQTKIKLKLV